jgi:hypothetical protein
MNTLYRISVSEDWDEMGFMESLLTWRRFVGDRMVIVNTIFSCRDIYSLIVDLLSVK